MPPRCCILPGLTEEVTSDGCLCFPLMPSKVGPLALCKGWGSSWPEDELSTVTSSRVGPVPELNAITELLLHDCSCKQLLGASCAQGLWHAGKMRARLARWLAGGTTAMLHTRKGCSATTLGPICMGWVKVPCTSQALARATCEISSHGEARVGMLHREDCSTATLRWASMGAAKGQAACMGAWASLVLS